MDEIPGSRFFRLKNYPTLVAYFNYVLNRWDFEASGYATRKQQRDVFYEMVMPPHVRSLSLTYLTPFVMRGTEPSCIFSTRDGTLSAYGTSRYNVCVVWGGGIP